VTPNPYFKVTVYLEVEYLKSGAFVLGTKLAHYSTLIENRT